MRFADRQSSCNIVQVLSKHLTDVLLEDLEQIPTIYRVSTDISSLLIATEKYFGIQANYIKGKGSMFLWWLRTYHPGVYLYATMRACGGTRQDGDTKGAGPVLMNLPLYLQFLAWRYGCGGGDGILEKSLFFRLRCVEMVGCLRVLSILHMCVVIPLRWLAGNCHTLSDWDFGVAKMAWTVDLMDAAFLEIANDGSKLFDDEFMFGIFQPIIDTIPPFGEYMNYMFKSKTSNPIGTRSFDKKVVPWEKLRSELMYPTRRDIVQSTEIACELAVVAAITFRREFRDTRKATAKYLSVESGSASLKILTAEQVAAGKGIEATNNAAERLFGASTEFLQTHGTIDLDHYVAPGMSRVNNDSGRAHKLLVSGKKRDPKAIGEGGAFQMGSKFDLPSKLQETLMIHAKEFAPAHKKRTKKWLAIQFEARQRAEEVKLKKKREDYKEENIVAIYFFEQFHSPRCWKTVAQARKKYNEMTANKLEAVKEQILIRYLGLGIKEAHHPWSKGQHTYTVDELLDHLMKNVIPLESELKRGKNFRQKRR